MPIVRENGRHFFAISFGIKLCKLYNIDVNKR